jgi:hypothetical protein
MENLWHSFIAHWANWVIPFVTWIFGTVMGATFRWFYPSRKEWREQRRRKADEATDGIVLKHMRGDTLPKPFLLDNRRFQASDIANALSLEVDSVFDSLERLETNHLVRRGGVSRPDIAPAWMLNPRQ